jgi:hypothetical protein
MNFIKTGVFLRIGFLTSTILCASIVFSQAPTSASAVQGVSTVNVFKPGIYPSNTPTNFVRTWEPQVPLTSEDYVVSPDRAVEEVNHSTQYLDGLGRPLQSVNWQASPVTSNAASSKMDIVTPFVYDEFGREQYKFLPYTSPTSTGSFKTDPFNEQSTFYGTTYKSDQPGFTNESYYYNKTIFEPSPLNRIDRTFAPGNSWAGSEGAGDHSIKMQYLVNDGNADNVRIWDIGFDAIIANNTNKPVAQGNPYPTGELYKTITTDEQVNEVIEFKDKEGHVVLKKVQAGVVTATDPYTNWLCTYYVYDDLGQLRFVIPPKAVNRALGNGWVLQ